MNIEKISESIFTHIAITSKEIIIIIIIFIIIVTLSKPIFTSLIFTWINDYMASNVLVKYF